MLRGMMEGNELCSHEIFCLLHRQHIASINITTTNISYHHQQNTGNVQGLLAFDFKLSLSSPDTQQHN